MLHFIRERAKGFFAWLIFILVVVPFAFWGINSYLGGSGDVYVAKINDAEVSSRVYQRMVIQERLFRQQVLGQNASPALMDDTAIKRSVLERLINTEAAAQAAEAAGFRVGNDLLRSYILGNPQFQREGRFDPQLYARVLNSMGMTEQAYEAELRRDLLVEQFMGGISSTAFITGDEQEAGLRLQYQQRRIGFLILRADNFKDDAAIPEEEVERYYNAHQEDFAIPEQVQVDYLELSAADLLDQVHVDEAALRKLYEERRTDFMVDEERRASHILIAVDEGADEKAQAAARKKAEGILARLRKGESFEKLAREYSDDPGSAKQGGDLGYFGRGVMARPFEDKVFSMQEGEIAGPVRTRFGYHIIKLVAIRPAHGRSFEEVRGILEREYREQQAEEMFYDLADRLSDLTYETPDTLDVAAQELGLTIKTSDFFSRDQGTGIAAEPKVRAAAFNPEVLEGGNNSDPVTIGQNHLVVLRVKAHRPSSHRPLAEVRGDIEQRLRLQRARDKAAEAGRDIQKRLEAGGSPQALAKEAGVEWHEPGFVDRRAKALPPAVVRTAFTLARPGDKPVVGGAPLAGGDYAVVALYEVKDGDPGAVAEADRKRWREQARNNIGRMESDAALESIKQRSEIEIRQENM